MSVDQLYNSTLRLTITMRRAVLRLAPRSFTSAADASAANTHSAATPPRADLSPLSHADSRRRRAIDAMLRVDHAGETAAVRIYEGQAAFLAQNADHPQLLAMAEHERAHLKRFQQLLPHYRARPSALLPVWSAAAYALGATSALLGRESAFAVTEAVEEVITAHYNDQLRDLAADFADEAELREVFRDFRDDEQEHLEEAVRRDAHKAPFYTALSAVVKTGCTGAIWLSKRL